MHANDRAGVVLTFVAIFVMTFAIIYSGVALHCLRSKKIRSSIFPTCNRVSKISRELNNNQLSQISPQDVFQISTGGLSKKYLPLKRSVN